MIRNILVLTIPSCLAVFLFLELTATFVVPAAQFPSYYYDPTDRILRFSTTDLRDGVFTIGAMAQQRAQWHINNTGWNSAIDFEETKRKPRIAIIGDSYVEALQVNVETSLAGRLRELVSPQAEVYAFGISGAPLSQYLQMARYARKHFDPDVLVINVVHNDFDESLCSIKRQAGMLCLEDEGQEIREAVIDPYHPNQILRMARSSSVVRYAVTNLQLASRLRGLFSGIRNKPTYNANIDVEQVNARKARIQRATEYVLRTLQRENGTKPVIFVMDAPRRDIYAGTLGNSTVVWLNQLLKTTCETVGFYFVDLTHEFSRHFAANHVHFESEFDWHWNETGHLTAAGELHRKLDALRLIQPNI
ncbi:MAG: SGNH/GDSL hydrolase family protein [Nitrospira sp.]|nr:SGNH/GDSL hydrolase family protein [Nitrospira sp.]